VVHRHVTNVVYNTTKVIGVTAQWVQGWVWQWFQGLLDDFRAGFERGLREAGRR